MFIASLGIEEWSKQNKLRVSGKSKSHHLISKVRFSYFSSILKSHFLIKELSLNLVWPYLYFEVEEKSIKRQAKRDLSTS